MKIKRLIFFAAAIVLLSSLFCSCGFNSAAFKAKNGSTVPQLSEEKIKMIRVWRTGYEEGRGLSEEEISAFTAFFNKSKVQLVKGASTPDFGAQVTLNDGTVFSLADEENGRMEVQFKGEDTGDPTYIYVINEDLWQFVKNCAEND